MIFENGSLQFAFNGMGGPMNHYHYDVFEVAERDNEPLAREKIAFHSNLQGDIDSLAVPLEPNVKEIVFSRLGDRRMSETGFLQPLTGGYQRGAAMLTVAMKGDHAITLAIASQPPQELEPVRGTRFRVKGQNNSLIEFRGDDLVMFEGNNVSVATRKR